LKLDKGSKAMLYETTKKWLDTLELTIEAQLHADLALALAARYDDKGETSTAGELRKTVNELKTIVGRVEEESPLRELLKRG
jgi:hypothetical protein